MLEVVLDTRVWILTPSRTRNAEKKYANLVRAEKDDKDSGDYGHCSNPTHQAQVFVFCNTCLLWSRGKNYIGIY